jgi:uncharacterized membrane protein
MSEQFDWDRAFEHLQKLRELYAKLGAPGIPALNAVLNPLLLRYERGERTRELYEAMLSTE